MFVADALNRLLHLQLDLLRCLYFFSQLRFSLLRLILPIVTLHQLRYNIYLKQVLIIAWIVVVQPGQVIYFIMIRFVYRKQRLWNLYQALWCFLIFIVNNLIFFFIVLKVSFQEFVARPHWFYTAVLLTLLLADSLYTPYITRNLCKPRWLIDLGIWLLVLLSFTLPNEQVTSFLGLAITIRIYDAVYLKEILFDICRKNYWLYKISIVGKIVYMILLYGHVMGCIFYAIEMILLNNQYFGEFSQNPLNYYQGQLLAFTPIYMFQNLNRYVYAMYYIFALISTIAFGDIIGKNYVQDAYVMILIIMSTITISIIIEQMYIIFRRKKNRYLQLLNQVRFLSERLKEYKQIPADFREEIINYLIEANWRYMNQQPENLQDAPSLKAKLIRQSIIANPALPLFFEKYMLHKLTLTNHPNGAQLTYNSPQSKQLTCFFIVKGKYWIGYETIQGRFPGGYEVEGEGMNFGVEESLVGTNNLYAWMCIRTVSFGTTFTLNATAIRQALDQLAVVTCPYDNPVEHYQIAKENGIFNRKKYECSVCHTFQHTLLNCPKCHLIITQEDLMAKLKAEQSRKTARRRKIASKKVLNISLAYDQIQEISEEAQRFKFIIRLKQQIKELRLQNQQQQKAIQKWHNWSIYQKPATNTQDPTI